MMNKTATLVLGIIGLCFTLTPALAHELPNTNHGSVADRLAIRELVESYNAAVIEKDPQKWIANWAQDGVWNLGGGDVQGKDEILKHWLSVMTPYEHAAMFTQPVFIHVDGDEATAQLHTNERLKLYSGAEMLVIGRYDDRYTRIKGVWKISNRQYSIVFTTARPPS
ncbi:MAG: nuclear transport factor 2 family protein [Halioglobus sp.]